MRMRMRHARVVVEREPGWRSRGLLFDTAAQQYLAGRPGYPDVVYATLVDRCGLSPQTRVLEIGAGAGQATLPLLALGARVTAVEPGAGLAAQLTTRTAGQNLDVIVSRFETVELPAQGFDLIVSATAFHWVDPAVGYPKCAQLLRPGGWLALWWTIWGDQNRSDPLHERLQPLLARKAPQLLDEGAAPHQYALDVAERSAEIARTGAFGPVEQDVIRWTGRHDPQQARALFATFSPWLALPEGLKTELLNDVETIVRDDLDGIVERPYLTIMYSCQHRSDAP